MSWLTERLATRMREHELTVDALARQLAVERSRLNAICGPGIRPFKPWASGITSP